MVKTSSQQNNSVRIIAGEYRSRKLEFPSQEGLRPTSDRIRETLFNWLQNSIQAEVCLDLFAGSGALGFEALSRGASRVDFIERDRGAASSIRANIELLATSRGRVICADALHWLAAGERRDPQYGLVFLDPPFKETLLTNAIAALNDAAIMRAGCLVYIEQDLQSGSIEVPDDWLERKSKKAGSVRYSLFEVSSNR